MKIPIKALSFTLLTFACFISCKKEYSYEGGNVNLATGTWQFVNNATQYNGTIDSAVIKVGAGAKVLVLEGKSLSGLENFRIRLFAPDSFTIASYAASLSQSDFDYTTPSKTLFKGDALTGEFTVTITALSSNQITGIFTGQVEDSSGAQTTITLGVFTSGIDLSNNGNGPGGTISVGTLGTSQDSCTPVTISGNYTQGTPLSASNTVQVQVNVTTPGTFFISTNSVNGVNFSKSGIFTTAGIQAVVLTGNDTPQNFGAQFFTVTYGTSNCTFEVSFLPGTSSASNYFPTTLGSHWVYSLVGNSDSISAEVIPYSPMIGSNVFNSILLTDIPSSGLADTVYYRKSGNIYYVNNDVKDYFSFDNPVRGEYVFLNDLAPSGTVIRSPGFNGTISGVPATGYVETKIEEKGVPATVGGFNFNDVIKVTYNYYLSPLTTPVFAEERWFARDIGLVYFDYNNFIIAEIGKYVVL